MIFYPKDDLFTIEIHSLIKRNDARGSAYIIFVLYDLYPTNSSL